MSFRKQRLDLSQPKSQEQPSQQQSSQQQRQPTPRPPPITTPRQPAPSHTGQDQPQSFSAPTNKRKTPSTSSATSSISSARQKQLQQQFSQWNKAREETLPTPVLKKVKSYDIEQHTVHHTQESSAQPEYGSLKHTQPTATGARSVLEDRGEWHAGNLPRGGKQAVLAKLDEYLAAHDNARSFTQMHKALTDLGDMTRWLKIAALPREKVHAYALDTIDETLSSSQRHALVTLARDLKKTSSGDLVETISKARNVTAHFYDRSQQNTLRNLDVDEGEVSTDLATEHVSSEALVHGARQALARVDGDKVSAGVLLDRMREIRDNARLLRTQLGGGQQQTTSSSPSPSVTFPSPSPTTTTYPPLPPQHLAPPPGIKAKPPSTPQRLSIEPLPYPDLTSGYGYPLPPTPTTTQSPLPPQFLTAPPGIKPKPPPTPQVLTPQPPLYPTSDSAYGHWGPYGYHPPLPQHPYGTGYGQGFWPYAPPPSSLPLPPPYYLHPSQGYPPVPPPPVLHSPSPSTVVTSPPGLTNATVPTPQPPTTTVSSSTTNPLSSLLPYPDDDGPT